MLYCIRIERELEEVMIQHEHFDTPPTDEDILDYIDTLDINYQPDYGKFEYYPVG